MPARSKTNKTSNIFKILVLFGILLIASAILIDFLYFSYFNSFGWWFDDDWTSFNLAGLFWLTGIAALVVIIIILYQTKGKRR